MTQFNIQNPQFKEDIQERLTRQFFMHHIGFKLTKIEAAEIEGEMSIADTHKQQTGFIHGGVTATLADIVQGFAAFSLLKPGESVVTADLRVSYFNPGVGVTIKARGRVTKPGSVLHFCEAEVVCVDEDGKETVIAKSTSTMCVVNH